APSWRIFDECPMWSAASAADFRRDNAPELAHGGRAQMMGRNPLRAAFAAFVTVAAGAAIAAPAAPAGILTKTATDCADPPLTHAFARYLDPMNYELIPGGTFEDGGAG